MQLVPIFLIMMLIASPMRAADEIVCSVNADRIVMCRDQDGIRSYGEDGPLNPDARNARRGSTGYIERDRYGNIVVRDRFGRIYRPR